MNSNTFIQTTNVASQFAALLGAATAQPVPASNAADEVLEKKASVIWSEIRTGNFAELTKTLECLSRLNASGDIAASSKKLLLSVSKIARGYGLDISFHTNLPLIGSKVTYLKIALMGDASFTLKMLCLPAPADGETVVQYLVRNASGRSTLVSELAGRAALTLILSEAALMPLTLHQKKGF